MYIIYLRTRGTSDIDKELSRVNTALIEAKLSARVTKKNLKMIEQIPTCHENEEQYYIYTFKTALSDNDYEKTIQEINNKINDPNISALSKKPDEKSTKIKLSTLCTRKACKEIMKHNIKLENANELLTNICKILLDENIDNLMKI